MKFSAKVCAAVMAAAILVPQTVPQMWGAALNGDARAAIPNDVQQLIVVDYRALQNSPVAMQLKDRRSSAGVEASGRGVEEVRV